MILTKNSSKKITTYSLIFFLGLQFVFWLNTNKVFPKLEIVENIPPLKVIKAISLGDEQFYFRKMGLELQFMGDTYNRFTPLKNYDYSKLYKWFILLNELDNKSSYIAANAAYYFAMSQNPEDSIYVVKFLREHAKDNPEKKWWWLFQAAIIAHQKLKNNDLALEIAYELAEVNTPLQMTKFLPAILLKEMGNKAIAAYLVKDLMNNGINIKTEDVPYVSFFLEELEKKKIITKDKDE